MIGFLQQEPANRIAGSQFDLGPHRKVKSADKGRSSRRKLKCVMHRKTRAAVSVGSVSGWIWTKRLPPPNNPLFSFTSTDFHGYMCYGRTLMRFDPSQEMVVGQIELLYSWGLTYLASRWARSSVSVRFKVNYFYCFGLEKGVVELIYWRGLRLKWHCQANPVWLPDWNFCN